LILKSFEGRVNEVRTIYLRLDLELTEIICFPIPLLTSKEFSFDIITEPRGVVPVLSSIKAQKEIFNETKIDYYFLCAVKEEGHDVRALCFSVVKETFFFIDNSKRFFQKATRVIKDLREEILAIADKMTLTLFKSGADETYIAFQCSDQLYGQSYKGKKGSTGSSNISTSKLKKLQLGIVNYSHRERLILNNNEKCFQNFNRKRKAGTQSVTKISINNLKDTLVEVISDRNKTIKAQFKLAKLSSKHIYDYFNETNAFPFRYALKDRQILSSLLDIEESLRPAIVSKFFEDLNWRFSPLENKIKDAFVEDIKIDIDSVVLELELQPSAEKVYNFLNEEAYDPNTINEVNEYINKYLLQENKLLEVSYEVKKDSITHVERVGHAYKYPRKKQWYIKIPNSGNIVFNIYLRFTSEIPDCTNKKETDLVWEALKTSFIYLSENKAYAGKGSSLNISLNSTVFRCYEGLAVPFLATLLLATRYSIEIIFENYNAKTNFQLSVKGVDDISTEYKKIRYVRYFFFYF
jgi:hypothetical protein